VTRLGGSLEEDWLVPKGSQQSFCRRFESGHIVIGAASIMALSSALTSSRAISRDEPLRRNVRKP
jgi:hypothetical protein